MISLLLVLSLLIGGGICLEEEQGVDHVFFKGGSKRYCHVIRRKYHIKLNLTDMKKSRYLPSLPRQRSPRRSPSRSRRPGSPLPGLPPLYFPRRSPSRSLRRPRSLLLSHHPKPNFSWSWNLRMHPQVVLRVRSQHLINLSLRRGRSKRLKHLLSNLHLNQCHPPSCPPVAWWIRLGINSSNHPQILKTLPWCLPPVWTRQGLRPWSFPRVPRTKLSFSNSNAIGYPRIGILISKRLADGLVMLLCVNLSATFNCLFYAIQ